ncbi:MAG: DoxX family protein [Myxococcales bacterium]|nr:DoxX family protein [Myxococcales bacterium]
MLAFGRVLLSLIFVLGGVSKVVGFAATTELLRVEGVPTPALFLALAIVAELAGGLSLMTGSFARLGALVLVLYLIPVTLIMHDFWNLGGLERQMQLVNFLKNLSVMGGLLMVVGAGAGAPSVDNRVQGRIDGSPPIP